ncbi:MAG: hypothetical protein JWR26_4752, partial [Pedosphaera sp.]|nr:hypothetical protein [Pedosphaera sp.]MDB6068544.1 hypothetical protein [Pedosphaera sp.]
MRISSGISRCLIIGKVTPGL